MKPSAGVFAMGKGADVGVVKKAARKRAVGTREHIVAYLAKVQELFDASGMASTRLSAAVGYPGSSVAFAQLLSGMERAGLIEREVRGKRTYRIRLGSAQAPRAMDTDEACAWEGATGAVGMMGMPGIGVVGGTAGFDYDELARRLLIQVIRRLAAAESGTGTPGTGAPGTGTPGTGALQGGLLAGAWAEHGKLAEENVRLREQLEAARQALELAADCLRKLPITTDLDRSEIVLLQQLLTLSGSGGAS
jgi:hypothetical protein